MPTPVRTLMRTIAEGSAWLTIATFLSKFLGVATTLVVLATLSVFEFGTSKLVLSVMGVFALFTLPGLTEIVVADMSIEKGKGRLASARNLLNQYFLYNGVLGVVAFLVLFFGAELVADYMHNEYVATLLRVLAFLYLIGPIRSGAYVLWRVQYQFGAQSLHKAFESIAKLVLTVYLLVVLEMNVYGYIIVYVLTDYIGLVPFLPSIVRSYRALGGTSETERLSLWQSLLGHGKWAVAQGYLHNLVQSARVWIVKAVLGTEAVGLFSAAYGMYQHVVGTMPLKHVLSSVIPQYDPKLDTFRKLIVKGVKYNVLGVALLGISAAVGVPVPIHFMMPEYVSAVPLFELLLAGMIPGAASGVFTVVFFALRKQRSMFWVNVALTGVTLVSLPLLLLTFGIYGVAIELFLTSVLFTWERYRRMCSELPDMSLPWRAFFTYDEFDRKILGKVAERIPWARR